MERTTLHRHRFALVEIMLSMMSITIADRRFEPVHRMIFFRRNVQVILRPVMRLA